MVLEDTTITKSSTKPEMSKYDDPNDPLYLHHSDQPRAILVTQQLNEETYPTWSRAMIMALIAKNKEGFIDGTIKRPRGTQNFNGGHAAIILSSHGFSTRSPKILGQV
ncbi:hypothetical protein ACFX13_013132 [Malus domestica]